LATGSLDQQVVEFTVVKMEYEKCARVICLLLAGIFITETCADKVEDYDVKKVDAEELKKTYGGKKISPPPEKLVVTDEVWFKFAIKDFHDKNKPYVGKVTIGCFGKLTPVTCLNFVSLVKGYRKGRGIMSYKNTKVQKIIRDFMIQMGDVETKYSKGDSIYGKNFNDESFALSHNHAGWVGMANFGPDTNGSQFYITLRSSRWLDGRNVIFGKVLEGMNVLDVVQSEETDVKNLPLRQISVKDCGINKLAKPYTLTSEQFNVDGDIREKSE